MDWSGIIGAAIGDASRRESEVINNVVGFQTQRFFNRKARSDWRKSLQRGPTYWAEGLRRAGINPLYALSKGPGPGSLTLQGRGMQPGASPGAGGFAPGVSSAISSRLAGAQVRELEARADAAQLDVTTRIPPALIARAEEQWLRRNPELLGLVGRAAANQQVINRAPGLGVEAIREATNAWSAARERRNALRDEGRKSLRRSSPASWWKPRPSWAKKEKNK